MDIYHPEDLHSDQLPESEKNTEQSQLQAELASCKEQALRVSADFVNFKKRMEKERGEWLHSGQCTVLKALFPTLIDLDRALQNAKSALPEGQAQWLEGFVLIQKNMHKALTDLGVQQVDTSQEFNPYFHEALMQVESSAHQAGHIVDVFSPGYSFKGEVVLHAKVSVAK